MRIAVVEDEHNAREGLIRLIGKMGAEFEVVGEAETGTQGLDLIQRAKPDLVITDIKMPEMSGLEMLGALKDKGLRHKAIILTGYSEYEYARIALKLSVSDYLEKPITASDLRESLDKVKREWQQQYSAASNAEQPETLESYFYRLMDLFGEEAERQEALIRSQLGYREDWPMDVAVFTCDDYPDEPPSRLKELLEAGWASAGSGIVIGMASRGIILAVAQPFHSGFDLEEYIEERLLPDLEKAGYGVVCSLGKAARLSRLKQDVEHLTELSRWSMILGRRKAIRREDVARVARIELPYPAQLESKCSRAIATANGEEVRKQFHSWTEEFKQAMYGPALTVEYSIRFVSYMLKLAGDVHGYLLPEPLQSVWQQSLRELRTIREFERIMRELAAELGKLGGPAETPVYGLLIRKAVRIIQERFAEGITLDEVADHLHVTTAYLSGQFNREVGQPFTAYIRSLRLRKAKELLLGSGLKTFEIAQKAGYPDPKYFSRVFKEATGMTPGEYQKLNG